MTTVEPINAKPTHTPWPWRAVGDEVRGNFGRCHVGEPICAPLGATAREASANALLIAAAPDLLAALRNITECVEAGADGVNMDIWVQQAKDAIALAMGERPAA